ncbi:MAG TPA: nicotinate-nucleotide--dimethylbenzimidazole phosphoribosyltransferase, partial [Acidimicrobiaceae bacterium]|nr:nicotinate-nucleotide--dimethylbenzimidazole phosphoribosyltransferase [Acidimicrobiaceae bacterium]
MNTIADQIADAPGPDVAAGDAVRARAADILRPAGALARLDELAAWVADWQ